MKDQKHTVGNWTVKPQIEKKKHASMFYVYSDGGKCNECGREIDGRHICVTLESATGMEQAKANAKLIASAPDLLKVCTDLLNAFVHKENDKKGNQTRTDIFKYCPEFGEIAVAARTAINKATE